MKRIAVISCCGAGKSTFSRSQRLRLVEILEEFSGLRVYRVRNSREAEEVLERIRGECRVEDKKY